MSNKPLRVVSGAGHKTDQVHDMNVPYCTWRPRRPPETTFRQVIGGATVPWRVPWYMYYTVQEWWMGWNCTRGVSGVAIRAVGQNRSGRQGAEHRICRATNKRLKNSSKPSKRKTRRWDGRWNAFKMHPIVKRVQCTVRPPLPPPSGSISIQSIEAFRDNKPATLADDAALPTAVGEDNLLNTEQYRLRTPWTRK